MSRPAVIAGMFTRVVRSNTRRVNPLPAEASTSRRASIVRPWLCSKAARSANGARGRNVADSTRDSRSNRDRLSPMSTSIALRLTYSMQASMTSVILPVDEPAVGADRAGKALQQGTHQVTSSALTRRPTRRSSSISPLRRRMTRSVMPAMAALCVTSTMVVW